LNIRADYFKNFTKIHRSDWLNALGTVGGIAGFYSAIIAFFIGYFAHYDYLTTVIKKLFLEE